MEEQLLAKQRNLELMKQLNKEFGLIDSRKENGADLPMDKSSFEFVTDGERQALKDYKKSKKTRDGEDDLTFRFIDQY